jgi:cell wall assembly regulator SMI1
MQSIRSIWERIETQLKIEASVEKMHPSEALSDFQVGATEEEIQAAEAALDSAFPEEIKASWIFIEPSLVPQPAR